MTDILRTAIDDPQPRPAIPCLPAAAAPAVSAAQMAQVDRLAVSEFGISLLAMMEQAGAHVAEAARLLLGDDLRGRSLVVAVGPGNNGGGALAAARHLANRGARVHVVLARPALRIGTSSSRAASTPTSIARAASRHERDDGAATIAPNIMERTLWITRPTPPALSSEVLGMSADWPRPMAPIMRSGMKKALYRLIWRRYYRATRPTRGSNDPG